MLEAIDAFFCDYNRQPSICEVWCSIKAHKMNYDFDYLMNLYKEDPDEFEKVTSAMIDDVINRRPEKDREVYRARQWRLEQELSKIKCPLERMNRMISIFWTGVNEFVEVTRNPGKSKRQLKEVEPCQVIEFKKKPED